MTAPIEDANQTAGTVVYGLAAAGPALYFAASGSGLRRSTDGGATWKDAYASLQLPAPMATLAVAVSPLFGKDKTVVAGVAGGVLVSTDGGRRWEAKLFPQPDCTVTALVFSPDFAQDGVALAGTLQDGCFRSTDRGRHWAGASFGLLDLGVLCLAASPQFATDDTLWAGTGSGVYRSTNGGRSWREANFPIEAAPVLSLAVSLTYATDRRVLAGTETGRLLHSTDAGLNWAPLGPALFDGPVNSVVFSGGRLLALVDETLHTTTDAAQTWTAWTDTEGVSAVCAAADGRLLAGGVDGAVWWLEER